MLVFGGVPRFFLGKNDSQLHENVFFSDGETIATTWIIIEWIHTYKQNSYTPERWTYFEANQSWRWMVQIIFRDSIGWVILMWTSGDFSGV